MPRLILSVFLAAWLINAICPAAETSLSQAELKQRVQEVEALSAIDRARLQRNWETYQKLPPDRQLHYQQLHQQLDVDRKTGGNKLNHTMQTYSQWLQTLTPGQREDLRLAKSPTEKLDLVRKFKEDQDHRNDSRPDPPPELGWMGRSLFRVKPLTSTELEAALTALVELLPASERGDLSNAELPKWIRYRRIVQASARQAGGPREWPNPEQQSAVLAAIKATEQGTQLQGMKQDRARRERFVHLFFSSFGAEMFAELAPFQPKQGDIEKVYEQLDNSTREDLLRLKLGEMNQALRQRFMKQQLESRPEVQEKFRAQNEFHEFRRQFYRDADLGFGRGFGGPRRGPDGDSPDRGGRRGPPRDDRR